VTYFRLGTLGCAVRGKHAFGRVAGRDLLLVFLGTEAVLASVFDGVAEVVMMNDLRTFVQVHVGYRAARLVGQLRQRVHPTVEWPADIANDVRLLRHDHLSGSLFAGLVRWFLLRWPKATRVRAVGW
jgi:hypothetical protein